MKNKRLKLLFLILIGLVLAVFSQRQPEDNSGRQPYTPEQIVKLTNIARGLSTEDPPALRYSFVLSKAAQNKADDMASRSYFAHALDGESAWKFITEPYAMAGENLAIGFTNSADMVFAWLASPGHRDNILNPEFTEIGIGVARTADKKRWIVVQEFIRPLPKPLPELPHKAKIGVASYYSYRIGDYDSSTHLVAAARDFPRKSTVRVTNLDNGNTVDVLITDYGPEKAVHPDRILDLSPKAFSILSGNGTRAGLLKNVSAELVKK